MSVSRYKLSRQGLLISNRSTATGDNSVDELLPFV